MKSKLIISLLVLGFVAFGFSYKTTEKETREVDNFNEIGISIGAELYLTQGAPQKVVIDGDNDDLENIKTSVSNGVLEISKKKGYSYLGKVKVYITVQKLSALSLAGSGDVFAETTIKNKELALSIAGSGNMNFKKLEVDKLKVEIAGSGDINLAGTTAEAASINIAGSGDVQAGLLSVNKLEINVAGSGDVYCKVNKHLKASLVGSGDVFYTGNPIINVESIGSGSVKHKENE